jgi:hypothetical protein
MPEESRRQQDVKESVRKARVILSQAFPETHATMGGDLVAVVSTLIDAVERLSDSDEYASRVIFGEPFPPDELESLHASLKGAQQMPAESKFTISFPAIELTVKEVWPDGDSPDDPTPQDVLDRMKDYSGINTVVGDWLLIQNLYVSRAEDEDELGVSWEEEDA